MVCRYIGRVTEFMTKERHQAFLDGVVESFYSSLKADWDVIVHKQNYYRAIDMRCNEYRGKIERYANTAEIVQLLAGRTIGGLVTFPLTIAAIFISETRYL